MPWKELGYAIAAVALPLTLYVGGYFATVSRTNFAAPYTETSTQPFAINEGRVQYQLVTEHKWKVFESVHPIYSGSPTLGAARLTAFFGPVHEIDRRLRPEYWKDQIVTEREPLEKDMSDS